MIQALRLLRENGATLLRQKGTHQVWALPSGKRVTLSVSRKNHSSAGRNALSQVKRMLRAEGRLA